MLHLHTHTHALHAKLRVTFPIQSVLEVGHLYCQYSWSEGSTPVQHTLKGETPQITIRGALEHIHVITYFSLHYRNQERCKTKLETVKIYHNSVNTATPPPFTCMGGQIFQFHKTNHILPNIFEN